LLAASSGPVSLADVVTELGIPKSSALMLLRTLVAKLYVERDADGRYQIHRFYRSSRDSWVGAGRRGCAGWRAPLMEDLALAVQETVIVGMMTPAFDVKIVEKVPSPREVRYGQQRGNLS